jgi:hypothetical protein
VDHEHLVAVDQLLHRGARLGRVAGVVLVDDLDLAPVDAAGVVDLLVEGDRAVVDRVAEDAGRTGQRSVHPDLDRGVGDADLRRQDGSRCGEGERARPGDAPGRVPQDGVVAAHVWFLLLV